MAKVNVIGYGELKVAASFGFVHDIGTRAWEVELPDGTRMKVVGSRKAARPFKPIFIPPRPRQQ